MKKNKQMRYFKSLLVFQIISAVIAAVGFLLYRYSWEMWIFGSPLMVIGVVGIVVCFIFGVSDRDYTEYFDSKFEAMPTDREAEPDFTAREYSFDGSRFVKADRSGTPRSEICVRTLVYFGKELKLVRGTVNAESDSFVCDTELFTSAKAEIENMEVRIGGSAKKLAKLKIIGDGREFIFPVKYNDIEIDRLADDINKKYGA